MKHNKILRITTVVLALVLLITSSQISFHMETAYAAEATTSEQNSGEEDAVYVCKNCGATKSFDSVMTMSDPITLNRTRAELLQGESLQLTADDVFNHVSWKSNNKDVATVTKKGLVKTHAPGIAVITAKDHGGHKATCVIHVKFNDTVNESEAVSASISKVADELGSYVYALNNLKPDINDLDSVYDFYDIETENNIEISESGLSHDWELFNAETIYIDEDELAASLRGTVNEIVIPEGLGGIYSVTCYGIPGWKLGGVEWRGIVPSSRQAEVHALWVASGAKYTNGVATIGDRYLIATTTYFGEVGNYVTFICRNGFELPCIIADSKATAKETGNKYGHADGTNVVEFEVDPDYYNAYGNPGSSAWFPEIIGGVGKAILE